MCNKCFGKRLDEDIAAYQEAKKRQEEREKSINKEKEQGKYRKKIQEERERVMTRHEAHDNKVNEAKKRGICRRYGKAAKKLDSDGWCTDCWFQWYND